MKLKSTREAHVLDVGGWQVRLGRPPDRLYRLPWFELANEFESDLLLNILTGPPETNLEEWQDFLGEETFEKVLLTTFTEEEDESTYMVTEVAVWDDQ